MISLASQYLEGAKRYGRTQVKSALEQKTKAIAKRLVDCPGPSGAAKRPSRLHSTSSLYGGCIPARVPHALNVRRRLPVVLAPNPWGTPGVDVGALHPAGVCMGTEAAYQPSSAGFGTGRLWALDHGRAGGCDRGGGRGRSCGCRRRSLSRHGNCPLPGGG